MTAPARFPDALMVPDDRKQGVRMVDRVASVCDYAEPLLGVDRSKGERAYIRLQGGDGGDGGMLIITKSTKDTILYPRDHARTGQHRYKWKRQPDGARFGYLKRRKKTVCLTNAPSESLDSARDTGSNSPTDRSGLSPSPG